MIKRHSIASYEVVAKGYGYQVVIHAPVLGRLVPNRYVNGKGYVYSADGYSTSEAAIYAGKAHVREILEKAKTYLNSALLELNEMESDLIDQLFL